mmetsp:Transcript_9113/g.26914  ORF Transcript_9113/g.26914 Transcript_9113/m.26914 type:complete len:352 (-) Transcript_9113:3238-4293(-)
MDAAQALLLSGRDAKVALVGDPVLVLADRLTLLGVPLEGGALEVVHCVNLHGHIEDGVHDRDKLLAVTQPNVDLEDAKVPAQNGAFRASDVVHVLGKNLNQGLGFRVRDRLDDEAALGRYQEHLPGLAVGGEHPDRLFLRAKFLEQDLVAQARNVPPQRIEKVCPDHRETQVLGARGRRVPAPASWHNVWSGHHLVLDHALLADYLLQGLQHRSELQRLSESSLDHEWDRQGYALRHRRALRKCGLRAPRRLRLRIKLVDHVKLGVVTPCPKGVYDVDSGSLQPWKELFANGRHAWCRGGGRRGQGHVDLKALALPLQLVGRPVVLQLGFCNAEELPVAPQSQAGVLTLGL